MFRLSGEWMPRSGCKGDRGSGWLQRRLQACWQGPEAERQLLRDLLASVRSPVIAFDAGGRVRAWNPAFCERFRIPPGRLEGARRGQLLQALARQAPRFGGGWEAALLPDPVRARPGREDVELPSGEMLERWCSRTTRGECIITLVDVTARRLAESGPRGGGVGTWDRDLERGTVSWSDRYWSMLGYDPRDVPEPARRCHDEHWPDIVHPADRPAVMRNLRQAYAGNAALLQDCRVQRADGGWLWVTWRGRIIRDAGGRAVRLVGTQTDIDAIVGAERALRAARDRAAAEARRKSGFLGSLSHELRTPLAGILGNLALLERELRGRAAQGRVQRTRRAAEELVQVLDAVLETARAEMGRLEPRRGVFRPRALVRGIADLMEPLARQKGLALTVTVDPAVPAWVQGPELTLRQILLNLASNAVKFTDHGSVGLAVAPLPGEPARLCFRVRDTGRGIDPARQARLFEQFYRAPGESAAGSGLGLYIVEQLAEAIEASVALESAPGEGTEFTVCAPLPAAAAPETPPPDRGRALRLLLVEDVPANREMLRDLLASEGHEVVAVAAGEEALEVLGTGPVDAVLMDLRLDGMDGCEAARRIRALPGAAAQTPVIALSADEIAHSPGAAPDFDGELRKPLCLDSLYRVLDGLDSGATAARRAPAGPDARLNELAAALGGDRLTGLLGSLRDTLSSQRRVLAKAAAADDGHALAAAAHRLAGAAGNYGYAEVESRARALRESGAAGAALAALDAAVARALADLDARLERRGGAQEAEQ